jgi:hypothetical protein
VERLVLLANNDTYPKYEDYISASEGKKPNIYMAIKALI